MKVKRRKTSKRKTLKQKYKILRKVAEHKKKIKKAAKKMGLKPKLKKDPGIPNLWPFKKELLEKIAKEHEEQKAKEEKKKLRKKLLKEKQKASGSNISDMAKLAFEARRQEEEFLARQSLLGKKIQDELDGVREMKTSSLSQASKRAYYREFKKVVEASDVILFVLDARDPLGCRCPDIEKSILTQDPNKKIVFLLNKIDLVPREVVQKWLHYLRKEYPTVAFKSSTQKKTITHSAKDFYEATQDLLKSQACLGADTLMQLLKNYTRSLDVRKTITVGVIGYPNVGKSSVINSLKRSKVVNVGAKPGVTKVAQEIHLDSQIKLLDCPGIIFSSGNLDADVILRNCVRIEQLDDPITPVNAILNRCNKEKLMEKYKIPSFNSTEEFLSHIAKQRGKMKKGGVPHLEEAAKIILQDWNGGKIPFYTLPPTTDNVVDSINRDNMMIDDSKILESLPSLQDTLDKDYIPMVASKPTNNKFEKMDSEDEDMEDEDEEEGEEDLPDEEMEN